MRRFFVLLLAAVLAFSLWGCGEVRVRGVFLYDPAAETGPVLPEQTAGPGYFIVVYDSGPGAPSRVVRYGSGGGYSLPVSPEGLPGEIAGRESGNSLRDRLALFVAERLIASVIE